MARRTKNANVILTPERDGFQWRFGAPREGSPTSPPWEHIPAFRFYGYQWWYNPNTRRFAVSSPGSNNWAMLTNKVLHDYLTTVISDMPTYEATQRMVTEEVVKWKAGMPQRPANEVRASYGLAPLPGRGS